MTIDSAGFFRWKQEGRGMKVRELSLFRTKDCKDGYRKDPILKVRIEIQTVRQGIMTMNKEARDNYLLPPSIPGKNNNYQ